ncbi:MAG: D-amino-acid transaminase [Cardiobacteriaceae bacterium]|nr:D-amino-acid transaminase [Cardiobacteriaceae bacterium]
MAERIVYVNGSYLKKSEATVSVFDRGFLMADAVYEVSAVIGGKMLDNLAHLQRLARSLGELNMPMPLPLAELVAAQEKLIADNKLQEGIIYLQVTRGSAERDFLFDPDMKPTLVMFTQEKNLRDDPKVKTGLKVLTQPDIRWQRRDIKTTQLLAQSLAKMIAKSEGYDDAWMVEDGFVTEGSSNNVWIIKGNTVITRPASHSILNGITRQALVKVIAELGLVLEERPFTVAEAKAADEAFATSASGIVMPVVSIDGDKIGDGKPGKLAPALREKYLEKLDHLL